MVKYNIRKKTTQPNIICHVIGKNGRSLEIIKKYNKTILSVVEYGTMIKPIELAMDILKTNQHRLCVDMDEMQILELIKSLELSVKSTSDCHGT